MATSSQMKKKPQTNKPYSISANSPQPEPLLPFSRKTSLGSYSCQHSASDYALPSPKLHFPRYLTTPPIALQTATASGSIGDLPVKIYCKQFNSLWQSGKHLDCFPRKPSWLKSSRFFSASSFLSLQT